MSHGSVPGRCSKLNWGLVSVVAGATTGVLVIGLLPAAGGGVSEHRRARMTIAPIANNARGSRRKKPLVFVGFIWF